jgi:hypothetical protein
MLRARLLVLILGVTAGAVLVYGLRAFDSRPFVLPPACVVLDVDHVTYLRALDAQVARDNGRLAKVRQGGHSDSSVVGG